MLQFRNNFKSGTWPAILIFAFTFIMIWNSSDSIRVFFLNTIETAAISFAGLFVLGALFQLSDKEEHFQPLLLWWAVMTMMLTLGRF